jgi:hypothetical protein
VRSQGRRESALLLLDVVEVLESHRIPYAVVRALSSRERAAARESFSEHRRGRMSLLPVALVEADVGATGRRIVKAAAVALPGSAQSRFARSAEGVMPVLRRNNLQK